MGESEVVVAGTVIAPRARTLASAERGYEGGQFGSRDVHSVGSRRMRLYCAYCMPARAREELGHTREAGFLLVYLWHGPKLWDRECVRRRGRPCLYDDGSQSVIATGKRIDNDSASSQ